VTREWLIIILVYNCFTGLVQRIFNHNKFNTPSLLQVTYRTFWYIDPVVKMENWRRKSVHSGIKIEHGLSLMYQFPQ